MGNSEGLVSVIMPIYNSEIFLSAAIESVLSQSYALFELLLVDDGSSDRSYDIMKEYEKRDTRVKCFCKKNGGVCSSRNYGVSYAQGKYIAFIDNDDIYDSHFLEILVSQIENDKSDIVKCGRRNILVLQDLRETKSKDFGFPKSRRYKYEELIKDYFSIKMSGCFSAVWNGLYRAEFLNLNNIYFNEKVIHGNEDLIFNYQILKQKPSISVVDKILYIHYYRISHSTSTKFYPDQVSTRIDAIKLEKEIISEIVSETDKNIIEFEEFRECIRIVSNCNDKMERKEYIFFIEEQLGRRVFHYANTCKKLNIYQKYDWILFKNRWYDLYFLSKKVQRFLEIKKFLR